MALITCDFFAESLGLSTSMTVILPQATSDQIGLAGRAGAGRFPVLYLLHGMSDDHTIWLRRTSIERYVAPLGLAVVMPAVARSYYCDMAHGLNYWRFISEELPRLVQGFFPISDRREDTFVAGLSMGGYGAFKLALNHPERFAAAASLSGALDPVALFDIWGPERVSEFNDIFGSREQIPGTLNDLYHLATGLKKRQTPQPELFQCCGSEDFLYQHNLTFKRHLESEKLDFTWRSGPGTHEWGYWDAEIQQVLNWLPLGRG